MFQSFIRCNIIFFAAILCASPVTTHNGSEAIKQALLGKIAYNESDSQVCMQAFFDLGEKTVLDDKTYLQLFSAALEQKKEKELRAFTEKHHFDGPLIYQKGAAVLELYLGHSLTETQWQLLSKQDWVTFFSKIPAQQRLIFLQHLYQPEMIQSPSARAFMIEMLLMVNLSQEALDLALFPISSVNEDLLNTYAQSFPAGAAPFLIAPLYSKASQQLKEKIVHSLMTLQADRPLQFDLSAMIKDQKWQADQRFSIARTAIAHGHSEALWQCWSQQSFNMKEQQLLSMEEACYRHDWDSLAILLRHYDQQDDFYLYYKAYFLAAQGDFEHAVWSLERVKNEALRTEARTLKILLAVKYYPSQAIIWAKDLVETKEWGPRELGVLQAQLIYASGRHHEATIFLEELVSLEMGYTPALWLLTQYYLESPEGLIKAQEIVNKYHLSKQKAERLFQEGVSDFMIK